jgi:hypothetical protein
MSKEAHDVFALVMNFLKRIGFLNTLQLAYFKRLNIRANIDKKFAGPFRAVWLDQKILAYVKYESANPNTMTYSFEINCKL